MKLSSFIISLLAFFLIINASAQETNNKSKLDIKASYSPIIIYPDLSLVQNNALFTLNTNYNINNFLKLGLYVGYGRLHYSESYNFGYEITYGHTPFYGINSELHILPLIINDGSKFDPYIIGKIGGLYRTYDDAIAGKKGHETEYSIGIGLSYFVWKDYGVYSEFCYGNFTYNLSTRMVFGITIRI